MRLIWCIKARAHPCSSSHLIGEAGADSRLDTRLEVCVGENNGRVFPSQLQGELLTVRGAPLCDALGGGCGAGEGDQGHIRVSHQRIACSGTSSEHDVDHTWRDACSTNTKPRARHHFSKWVRAVVRKKWCSFIWFIINYIMGGWAKTLWSYLWRVLLLPLVCRKCCSVFSSLLVVST